MPPITYISAFTRTDAKGGSRGEAMPERENAKIVNAGQKVAQIFAFGEFWRHLSHLGKFNTCQWHSACTKFGHSNNFATLSLSLSLSLRRSPVTHLLRSAGTRALIYGFLCRNAREASLFFVPMRRTDRRQGLNCKSFFIITLLTI